MTLAFESGLVTHWLARYLEGAFVWPLPLCWEAEVRTRGAGTGDLDDDELWWLAVDLDAIDPTELVATTDRDAVTCRDCLEWLHA